MTGIINNVDEMATVYSVTKLITLSNSVKFAGEPIIVLSKKPNKRLEAEVSIDAARRVAPTLS